MFGKLNRARKQGDWTMIFHFRFEPNHARYAMLPRQQSIIGQLCNLHTSVMIGRQYCLATLPRLERSPITFPVLTDSLSRALIFHLALFYQKMKRLLFFGLHWHSTIQFGLEQLFGLCD